MNGIELAGLELTNQILRWVAAEIESRPVESDHVNGDLIQSVESEEVGWMKIARMPLQRASHSNFLQI